MGLRLSANAAFAPPAPRLRERLGGQIERHLGVERAPRQEQEHRLGFQSIERHEALGISHHP